MDAYSKLNEYVDKEKQEHSAATNISKEEHEMKKTVSPQEIHQQLTRMDSKSKLKKVLSRQQQRVSFSRY